MPETQIAKPQTVFSPFVPASESRPEFTIRAVLLGAVFGLIFGAVTVYVGLRAGLTVAASIPIAVITISLLRYKGKPSVLETIVVQTCGNAGQCFFCARLAMRKAISADNDRNQTRDFGDRSSEERLKRGKARVER